MPELSDPTSIPAEPTTADPPPPEPGTARKPAQAPPTSGDARQASGDARQASGDARQASGDGRPRGRAPAQWAFPPRASVTVRIGMALFAIGVLAVVVVMGLFASGSHDLPLWLNLTAMLAPLGFAVGLAGVAVDARRSSRALAAGDRDQEPHP